VPFIPTPQPVVEKMLELADIKQGDVVYDLGCGDGRIVVMAAVKYGVKAVGFDIDPAQVREARANVQRNGVEHLVTIQKADIFTLDLREASVVTLYLLPELNQRLRPQLRQLKPGSRIVSHDFDLRGAKPVVVYRMAAPSEFPLRRKAHAQHTIFKWIVPWESELSRGLGHRPGGPSAGIFPHSAVERPTLCLSPGDSGDWHYLEQPRSVWAPSPLQD
jgi:SAM-dependent methyltransferase